MKITVKLPSAYAVLAENQKKMEIELEGDASLAILLDLLARTYPELKQISGIGRDAIPDHVNVYYNGDNVRYLNGLETPLKNGDTVQIIPAEAAG